MKTIVAIGVILALVYTTQSCVAGTKNNQPETISGTIRVVGNEPFTHLIIRPASPKGSETGSQDTLITGPLSEELRNNFQGKSVTLEGAACASPLAQFGCFRPAKIVVE